MAVLLCYCVSIIIIDIKVDVVFTCLGVCQLHPVLTETIKNQVFIMTLVCNHRVGRLYK